MAKASEAQQPDPMANLANAQAADFAAGAQKKQAETGKVLADSGKAFSTDGTFAAIDLGAVKSAEFQTKKNLWAREDMVRTYSKSDLRRMVEHAAGPGLTVVKS